MKNIITNIIMPIMLIILISLGFKTYVTAIDYEKTTKKIVESQNITDLTKTNLKSFTNKISFGWFKDKKKEELDKKKETKIILNEQNMKYILLFSTITFLILISYFFIDLKLFNIYGSMMTIIILFYGLITPLLMITIHKNIDYVGDVVLSFESKSLAGSIYKLFENGETIIASIIIIFSVIIPIIKTGSLLLIAIFEDTFFTHKLIGFFKMIGKWSMLDVFVVAVLLVFLSVNKGDISKAEVEVGIYIFFLYVVSSMLLSLSANKMLNQIKINKKGN